MLLTQQQLNQLRNEERLYQQEAKNAHGGQIAYQHNSPIAKYLKAEGDRAFNIEKSMEAWFKRVGVVGVLKGIGFRELVYSSALIYKRLNVDVVQAQFYKDELKWWLIWQEISNTFVTPENVVEFLNNVSNDRR